MKRIILNLILVMVVFVLTMSTSAYAEGKFYLNASVGQSSIDNEVYGIGFDEATSFSLGIGYFFNNYFGLECSYIDLGDAEDDVVGLIEVSADALMLMAVGKYDMSDMFSVYAKVGMAAWDGKVSAPGYGSESEDGTDLTWAAGMMINFTEQFSFFGQYQAFDLDDLDIDNISLGIQYHF